VSALAARLPRKAPGTRTRAIRREQGYSLIELSVAILIALFLIGGVLVVEQGTHRTYGDQSGIATLQDEERFSMSTLTNVISSAGYYPDPTSTSLAAAFPAAGNFQGGQVVFGPPSGASAPVDSLFVRYMTANGDGIDLCDGTTNNLGANTTFTSYLYVSGNALYCQVQPGSNAAWGTAVALVNGVTNMQVWYGVNTSGTDFNVDTYIPSTNMSNTNWQSVSSVMVELTFLNPLYGEPGQTQYVTFRRIIGVMGRD
jgi:type IV pilus assembly protein PilW